MSFPPVSFAATVKSGMIALLELIKAVFLESIFTQRSVEQEKRILIFVCIAGFTQFLQSVFY